MFGNKFQFDKCIEFVKQTFKAKLLIHFYHFLALLDGKAACPDVKKANKEKKKQSTIFYILLSGSAMMMIIKQAEGHKWV